MELTTIPSVDVDHAAGSASAANSILLDVREYEEFMSGGMNSWASFGHPLVNHAGNPGVVL